MKGFSSKLVISGLGGALLVAGLSASVGAVSSSQVYSVRVVDSTGAPVATSTYVMSRV